MSLLVFCLVLPQLSAQVVYQDQQGELTIKMPDGTIRDVLPSDSILFKHAFENILPLPEKERPQSDKIESAYQNFEGSLMDEREVSISMKVRTTENRIRFLQKRILELESTISELNEQLEYARANPGRIRPNDRIELSNTYNSAVDEKARAIREIPRLKEELVIMKRQNHFDVLAQLHLPNVPIISASYFLHGFELRAASPSSGTKQPSEEQELAWEAPTDIPMPIIPHPSTVEIRDIINNPPKRACRLITANKDSEPSNYVIRTESENLTIYLPAEMRIHRRGRPMLTIDHHFEVRSGGKFLILDIYLKIPSARRSMGGIRKNTPIRMEMMDGQIINLRITNEDTGTFFQDLNEVHFRAEAPLSRQDYQILVENEIDKLRLQWDSGFQDYEVFDIRVIMHQLNCLNQYISKK